MIPDEGRWPACTLICYPTEAILQIHLLFDKKRTAIPNEIAKLAHGLDHLSHIACTAQNEEIKLAGIHVNSLATKREYGFGPGIFFNTLEVSIKGPGHIMATVGVVTLVFRAGVISTYSSLKSSNNLSRLLSILRQNIHDDDFDIRLDSLADIVNNLMASISRLGHGGMVIFADSPKTTHFSSYRQSSCYFLRRLIAAYCMRRAEQIEVAGGFDKWLESPDNSRFGLHNMCVAAATDRLENCIHAIANLSGMDGAIVLTYGLNIGAFNAIIDRQDPLQSILPLVDVKGNILDYQQIFSLRGSRHQSGMLYARTVANSFVFVISQDGSISTFHNPNSGSVICEFDLRPSN